MKSPIIIVFHLHLFLLSSALFDLFCHFFSVLNIFTQLQACVYNPLPLRWMTARKAIDNLFDRLSCHKHDSMENQLKFLILFYIVKIVNKNLSIFLLRAIL